MNLNEDEIAVIKSILKTMSPDVWSQIKWFEIARHYAANSAIKPSEDDCYSFADKCTALGIGER